jgi:hypothetical protein
VYSGGRLCWGVLGGSSDVDSLGNGRAGCFDSLLKGRFEDGKWPGLVMVDSHCSLYIDPEADVIEDDLTYSYHQLDFAPIFLIVLR